jgi:hypothetical protein
MMRRWVYDLASERHVGLGEKGERYEVQTVLVDEVRALRILD